MILLEDGRELIAEDGTYLMLESWVPLVGHSQLGGDAECYADLTMMIVTRGLRGIPSIRPTLTGSPSVTPTLTGTPAVRPTLSGTVAFA
jgi:hypothetical protein